MSFNIRLYNSTADPKRVDKSDYLTEYGVYSGTLKDSTSVVNPVVIIEADEFPQANYVHIFEFHRYYFITNVVSIANKLWEIHMTCDVLHTYRASILKCYGFVDRCETGYDSSVVDDIRTVRSGVTITDEYIENNLFVDSDEALLLITGFRVKVIGG